MTIENLVSDLKEVGKSTDAAYMDQYMKYKFRHLGLKAGPRRETAKPYLQNWKALEHEATINTCKQLWSLPWRECHHIGQELMEKNLKRKWRLEDIDFLEWMILNNSWWDTVDFVAPKLIGPYMKMYPSQIPLKVNEWIRSENIWLKRTALLFQLKYKDSTDLDLLFNTILKVNATKEFFVDKAIGWILRENHYREPKIIESFVQENRAKLAPLSIKEALKHA